MPSIMTRADWTSTVLPERKLTRLVPGEVLGIAVHYTGSSRPLGATATLEQSRKRLEDERLFHTDGRGWSDIAYNAAIDQAGRVFPLRGPNYRSAANGNEKTNRAYLAVTFLIGVGDTPTPAAVQAFRGLRQQLLQKYPHATAVVGHRDLYSTACPGDPLYAKLGELKTSPAQEDDDMPTSAEVAHEVWTRFTITTPEGKEVNLQTALELILGQLAKKP